MALSARVDAELEASVPTPVLDLSAGSPDFGPGRLLVKNDGISGQTYGGNKTRKLAPVFQALRARGIRQVLTTGTAGSHHVLAMGIFGPAENVAVRALLFPQVHTAHTENVLRAISTLEIELLPCRDSLAALRHANQLVARGTAWVGPGALGPTSTQGYVYAFDEWKAQRLALGLGPSTFEHHVVAAGSGGTAAGLLAGLCASANNGRVVAVAVNHNPTLRSIILAQAVAVSSPANAMAVMNRSRLHVTSEALGAGYGRPTRETYLAIEAANRVGLTLEHTYTAKAFSVAARLSQSRVNEVVVFWQTLSQRPLDPWLAHAPPLSHLDPALRRLIVF